MRYASAASFRRTLEDRLRQRARETGQPLVRLRKVVAFQRLLARLQVIAPESWLLKGRLALDFRLADRSGPQPRATKDMDLARMRAVEAAEADFRAVLRVDLDDFFEFGVERIAVPQGEDKVAGGAGLRYRVTATVASRTFEQVTVDIGLAPPPVQPELAQAPDLLDFAGVPPLRVLVLPTPWHIAENVHAYTRRYGPDEAPSSRPKDLIDIGLLAAHEEFRAGDPRRALRETFDSRATHGLPEALPRPPEEWAKPYAELAQQVGMDRSLEGGYRRARALLDPVLNGLLVDAAIWQAGAQAWRLPTEESIVTGQGMTRDDALAMEGTDANAELPRDNAPE